MESDMPCPKHGTEYITIGDKRVCPKCGRTAGYKQIDIVQLLKENEQLKSENVALQENCKFYKKMWIESAQPD